MSIYKELSSKPWEYRAPTEGTALESAFDLAPEKVALRLFMVVAGVIFSLVGVTYYVRLDLGDWVPLSDPGLLWWNTGLLVVGSVCLQISRNAAFADNRAKARSMFILSGLFSAAFVTGQWFVWQQLTAAGLGVNTNPASAFFFLLTGLHLVHVLGGLWVWSKTAFRLLGKADLATVKLSIELCTSYWHFLLVLWVLLFAALANT
ncbi:MAG: cytochrome c oxidase subunit 3 [Pseudohongiellaceae bacterium]|nr:cytochrome c oxidase subunit 3 [Pseudohongiellaceae bacterium]